jgi:hypothetical protein
VLGSLHPGVRSKSRGISSILAKAEESTDRSPCDMRLPSVWDIALVVALAVFVLAMLDVFLSGKQKEWLDDRTLHVWHWLAEAKRKSLLNWLQRHFRSIAWTGVLVVSFYMAWAFEKALAPLPQVITVALCIFAVGLLFGLKIIQLTLRAPTLFRAVIRATIIAGVTLMPADVTSSDLAQFTGYRSMSVFGGEGGWHACEGKNGPRL